MTWLKPIFLIWMFFIVEVTAATELKNKLKNNLPNVVGEERLDALEALTNSLYLESPAEAIIYAEEALSLFKLPEDHVRYILVKDKLFHSYFNLGEVTKAESLIKQAVEMARKHQAKTALATTLDSYAVIFNRKYGDYKRAIELKTEACEIFESLKDDDNLRTCLNNLGLTHYYSTNYEEALTYFHKSIEVGKRTLPTPGQSYQLSNIALVFMQYGQWQKAIDYYIEALEFTQKFEQQHFIADQMHNLGVAYFYNDQNDLAIDYLLQAESIQKVLGNARMTFLIKKRLGEVYLEEKQEKLATQYYEQALALANEMEIPDAKIQISFALGLLKSQQQQYDEAVRLTRNALEQAEQIGQKSYYYEAHRNLSGIYKRQGNYELALSHMEKWKELEGEKLEQSRIDKVTELEEGFKAKEREAEIALLTKDKKLQELTSERYINYAVTAFVVLITLGITAVNQQRKKAFMLAERAEFIEEMMAKKNQMLAEVSHELGTPLTVLKLQVEALKDDLEDDVYATYDSLENKLNDIDNLITDIHQLAQADSGALNIEKTETLVSTVFKQWLDEWKGWLSEHGMTLISKYKISDSLNVEMDQTRIKQVITNVLSNCIKYGEKPGNVQLSLTSNGDDLSIEIEDSGPGVEDTELTNIFERLYRIENSRSRETGGSGLGLAISKSLVEAHAGSISASRANLGGLKIAISLPAS